jgi:invasion protein IalB
MKLSFPLTGRALAAGLLILSLPILSQGAALAQGAAPAAPPTPTDVQVIGDWTVHCFPVASPNPCEMTTEMDAKDTHQRVLGVTIAYVPSADKHVLIVAVPLGVAIPKGLVIQTDSFTSPMLPYRSCDRAGCYVEMVIDNGSVDSMSHSGPVAAIKVVADGGKGFDLRLSLNGFSAAHDKMAELAKQKATKTPPPTAPAQIDASQPPAK